MVTGSEVIGVQLTVSARTLPARASRASSGGTDHRRVRGQGCGPRQSGIGASKRAKLPVQAIPDGNAARLRPGTTGATCGSRSARAVIGAGSRFVRAHTRCGERGQGHQQQGQHIADTRHGPLPCAWSRACSCTSQREGRIRADIESASLHAAASSRKARRTSCTNAPPRKSPAEAGLVRARTACQWTTLPPPSTQFGSAMPMSASLTTLPIATPVESPTQLTPRRWPVSGVLSAATVLPSSLLRAPPL